MPGIFSRGNETVFSEASCHKKKSYKKSENHDESHNYFISASSCPLMWATFVWTARNTRSHILTKYSPELKTLTIFTLGNQHDIYEQKYGLDSPKWTGWQKKRNSKGREVEEQRENKGRNFNMQSSSYFKTQVFWDPLKCFQKVHQNHSPPVIKRHKKPQHI